MFGLGEAAGSDKERLAFLHMANTWLYAAANLEGRLTRPSNQNSPTPPPQLVRMKRVVLGILAIIRFHPAAKTIA